MMREGWLLQGWTLLWLPGISRRGYCGESLVDSKGGKGVWAGRQASGSPDNVLPCSN